VFPSLLAYLGVLLVLLLPGSGAGEPATLPKVAARVNGHGRKMKAAPGPIKCIFADLDGTLCHFDRVTKQSGIVTDFDDEKSCATVRRSNGDSRKCRVLPSSTMGRGVISEETVGLIQQIREKGVKFVIITGARTSTILERMPMLPICDAIACETGSKILFPPAGSNARDMSKPSEWTLDSDWSEPLRGVTGPLDTDLPASERQGELWKLYNEMKAKNLDPDVRGYYGCFRVKCKTEEHLAAMQEFLASLDELKSRGIGHAMNLGCYDFFPLAAGKGNVVQYLQRRWQVTSTDCVALFDDDNDLPMTQHCATGFLPWVHSDSVRKRLPLEPSWHLASTAGDGVFATEEILGRILELLS